ncbi:MAG TPA: hypothetical protein VLC28_03790, partial [Flavitalea sp.]|nr:hypothetical protein [Flavitalea sp.]
GITSSWNSEDAVHWTKRADSLPFGAIRNQRIIVFKKKLLLLSHHLWESEDGIEWKKIRTTATPSFKQCTPVLYNNLLWVFGAGSSQEGLVKIMVSPDATKWDTMDAPWVERSSPALCVFRGKIFMGGGNHPVNSGKSSRDSLLNDIWQMEQ